MLDILCCIRFLALVVISGPMLILLGGIFFFEMGQDREIQKLVAMLADWENKC